MLLIYSFPQRSCCFPDADFVALTGIPVDCTILFRWINCDLSVASLKTMQIANTGLVIVVAMANGFRYSLSQNRSGFVLNRWQSLMGGQFFFSFSPAVQTLNNTAFLSTEDVPLKNSLLWKTEARFDGKNESATKNESCLSHLLIVSSFSPLCEQRGMQLLPY